MRFVSDKPVYREGQYYPPGTPFPAPSRLASHWVHFDGDAPVESGSENAEPDAPVHEDGVDDIPRKRGRPRKVDA